MSVDDYIVSAGQGSTARRPPLARVGRSGYRLRGERHPLGQDQSKLATPDASGRVLPQSVIGRWMRPLLRFWEIEANSGVLLLACAAVALIAANSPVAEAFHALWEIPIGFSLASFELRLSLHHWINDGLMTIFFFVVGFEIKREFVLGELRDPRSAALPLAAALGGMLVPVAIQLALQLGGSRRAAHGGRRTAGTVDTDSGADRGPQLSRPAEGRREPPRRRPQGVPAG